MILVDDRKGQKAKLEYNLKGEESKLAKKQALYQLTNIKYQSIDLTNIEKKIVKEKVKEEVPTHLSIVICPNASNRRHLHTTPLSFLQNSRQQLKLQIIKNIHLFYKL